MDIAKEILRQLGGNKFAVMTGSKNFVSDKNKLRLKLAKNSCGATHLTIELNSMDLYDLTFVSCRGRSIKVKKEVHGIYGDMLQKAFTDATGLYTYL